MADWIDILSDAIFHTAQQFMDVDRPRRLVGVVSLAIASFGVIGTLTALALGAHLHPAGYWVVIPSMVGTAAVSLYCFLTEGRN